MPLCIYDILHLACPASGPISWSMCNRLVFFMLYECENCLIPFAGVTTSVYDWTRVLDIQESPSLLLKFSLLTA